jgi:hypothetical protein
MTTNGAIAIAWLSWLPTSQKVLAGNKKSSHSREFKDLKFYLAGGEE